MLESIVSLTAVGFQLEDIYNLPLDVFYMYSDMSNRLEAKRRLGYITDTSAAVAGILSAKSGVKDYAEDLKQTYLGEGDGRRKTGGPDRRAG